jgi:hypothetical protein
MSLRSTAKSSLAWAFGICLSILFVSLWGRAVVSDTATLGDSLAPMGGSELVAGVVTDWMAGELDESAVAPEIVDPTVRDVIDSPSVTRALGGVVGEMVNAAASADPDGSSVDMRSLIAPVIPEVTSDLVEMGYAVDDDEIRDVVESLDPLVIRHPGTPALVGPNSTTASRLGTASLVAAIGLLGFGIAVIYLSEDRIREMRGLLNRVALGGLSFAVFLRIGAWVADPRGGRAPVRESISNLANSKWVFPLQIGLVAGLIAGAVYVVRRYVRRAAVSLPPVEQPTPPPARPMSSSTSR